MSQVRAFWVVLALGVSSTLAAESARVSVDVRPGEPLEAGQWTTLRFEAGGQTEEMEVLLSLDAGRTFQLRVTREMSGGAREVRWRVPNLPTAHARLALRARDAEDREEIRAVSDEFAILPADAEPLETVRGFRGEWRAGEALEEIPAAVPIDAPGLGEAGGTLRALHHETELDRTTHAAPTGAPSETVSEKAEPARQERISTPASPPLPLKLPQRE